MHTLIVYDKSMQTTIRIDKEVLKMLEEQKLKLKAKSYNELIKKLIDKEELSMFGADKGKLKKWKESEDRAKFREY